MIKTDVVLDAKGLACPMPIVRTKKAVEKLEPGQVIEVLATDKGSKADLAAWSKGSGHSYLGTVEEGDVLKHYIRKSSGEGTPEKKHQQVVSNEQVVEALQTDNTILIDVREAAEYAFSHIPNAKSIPLGELATQMDTLPKDATIYVVCRTGNRSDLASQQLADAGFEKVFNVVPGMSEWSGETEQTLS